ncbi:MAG: hypothetical protein OER95_01470 [Acidimicrobiia bacterium]|nr:hypothetical protein [Acidimicrobiia bacterium]
MTDVMTTNGTAGASPGCSQSRRGRGEPINWGTVRSIAGLKFRIIRHTPQAIIGMILGLLLGGFLSTGIVGLIIGLAENEHRGSILTFGGALGLILWFLAPLVLGGGELILDLRTLAVYPLNRPTLLTGLLLASTIGIPFIFSLLVPLTAISHATSSITAVILVVAAVQLAVTGVLAGRVSVGLVSLLATTRFRSVAGGITVLAAITLGIGAQIVSLAAIDIKPDWFDNARSVIRLFPIGWTPEAMAQASLGQPIRALLFLLLGSALPLVLIGVWQRVVQRLLDGEAAQSRLTRSKPLVPGWMDRLSDRRTAVVWAKSLRTIRRDPREWTELAAFLPLVLAFSLPTLTQLNEREPNLVLMPFLAAVSGATMVSTNLFGGDANRFVTDVFPGDDFQPILVGKFLPRVTLVAIIVVVANIGLAWFMGGWRFLPVALVLVVQSLLIGAAAGVWVSIRSPIPLPEKVGGFNAANAGCIAPLFQILALFVADTVAILLGAPAVLTALAVSPWMAVVVAVVTLVPTYLMVKRRIAAEAVNAGRRIPEITVALTRRT